MATEIKDPWDGGGFLYATEAIEDQPPTLSRVLGPNGRPFPLPPRQKIGFDLRPGQGKGRGDHV